MCDRCGKTKPVEKGGKVCLITVTKEEAMAMRGGPGDGRVSGPRLTKDEKRVIGVK